MSESREQDQKRLLSLPPDLLMDLFFTHTCNIWRVDGLYLLGIKDAW